MCSIKLFNNQISQWRITPQNFAITGIKETAHNINSPKRTMLDNGTAIRLVSKK
jgi:hypothetical protein